MELGCGEYMTGDVVPVIPAGHAVSMRAKGVRAGDRVRLISDRGLEREWVTAAQDSARSRLRRSLRPQAGSMSGPKSGDALRKREERCCLPQ